MKKYMAVFMILVLLIVNSGSCALASAASLSTMCSLHEFSNRFTLATFTYNTEHEFKSENMESSAGEIKNCITTYFPEANAYVDIFMPVNTKDICEIVVHNYLGNTSMQSMNLFLLMYEIVMAAGGFSTSAKVNACMDALGMLDNFEMGNSGNIDYEGLHLYWLLSDVLGFVFCVSSAR